MAYNDVISGVAAGSQRKVVVIGNSVGCGQTANDINGTPINTSTALISTHTGMFNKLVGTTSNGSANPNLTGTAPAKGWVNQLYTYLKGKNSSNVLINESGSGWSTGDHLGGLDTSSGWTWTENTINKIVNSYTVKPDIVLVPLQINDWGHWLGLSWFNTHYAQILDTLITGLPNAAIVVVIESPVYNRSALLGRLNNYDADIVNESGAKYYYDAARSMAQARGLAIMDLNTPIDTLAKAASGASYGAKLWNTGLMADGNPDYPIHPNQAGQDLLATAAISFFNSYQTIQPPLIFTAQPTAQSATIDGGLIAYGTADPSADDVSTAATSFVSATAIATFREAATAIITAGVSATDTRQMLESVFSAATVTAAATDTQSQVESMLAQVEAFPTVQDILALAGQVTAPFIFTAQPSVSMVTGDGGIIAYGTADTGADDVASSADVAVSLQDIVTRLESLIITIQALPTVTDIMAQIEAVTSTAQADAAVVDVQVKGVAESLLSAASVLTTINDLQMMVDGVTTVAQTEGSITSVSQYLDSVISAVTSKASVTDILIALLETGPHEIIALLSPITTRVNLISQITRKVERISDMGVR